MTNDINSSEKTCFKCGTSQPRSEFYKHSEMADGLLGKCKTCTKKDSAAHRNANLEACRAYDRERGKTIERIKSSAEHNKRWRSEDKRRSASHKAVCRAIRNGAIVKQPCVVCGSESSMAHHESYDRPLDVTWYCQVHHKQRHKEMVLSGIEP